MRMVPIQGPCYPSRDKVGFCVLFFFSSLCSLAPFLSFVDNEIRVYVWFREQTHAADIKS